METPSLYRGDDSRDGMCIVKLWSINAQKNFNIELVTRFLALTVNISFFFYMSMLKRRESFNIFFPFEEDLI